MDGFQKAIPGTTIATAPRDITLLRERKSKAELDLLKCANEVSGVNYSPQWVVVDKVFQVTLLAIREVRKKMFIGMRESQARHMMASALDAAGLQGGECLTLFGGLRLQYCIPLQ